MKKLNLFLSVVLISTSVFTYGCAKEKPQNKNAKESKISMAKKDDKESKILKAKKIFEIPDSFKDFHIESEKNENGMVTYNLIWHDEENDMTINVTMDRDENILSYNKIGERTDKDEFTLDKKIVEDEANKIVSKIDKNLLKSHKIKDVKFEIYRKTAYVIYERNINGIEFLGRTMDLELNLNDLSLNHFDSGSFYTLKDKDAPTAKDAIKREEALKKIEITNPVKLMYIPDYSKNMAKLFYTVDGDTFLDAKTGKSFNIRKIYDEVKEEAKDSTAKSAYLTEEEKKGIEEYNSLIKKEELRKKVAELIPNGSKIGNEEIRKSGENYFYDFSANTKNNTSVYFTLDAKDGSLTGYLFSTDSATGKVPSHDLAKQKAVQFKEKYAPKKSGIDMKNPTFEEYPKYLLLTFNELHDGIPIKDYGIQVGFEKSIFSSFNLKNFNGKFESKADIKSLEEAKKVFFDEENFKLLYVEDGGKLRLIYGYSDGENISAKDLKKHGSLGEFLNLEKSLFKSDLESLATYGYGFNEDRDVMEAAKIKDLLYFIEKEYRGDISYENFSENDVDRKFKDLKLDENLTRLSAIKIILMDKSIDYVERIDPSVFKTVGNLSGKDLSIYQIGRGFGLTKSENPKENIKIDEMLSMYYKSLMIR